MDAARVAAGRDPLDDPLPDDPDDGGLALRDLLSHPPDPEDEEDLAMTIDVLALRIHTGADTAQVKDLMTHFFGGSLPLQPVGLSAPANQTVAPPTPDDEDTPPVPAVASNDAAPEDTASADSAATTDAAGLPWDERIHAGSKVMNADGTWRRKRGVDEATAQAVEAELRGVPQAPADAGEPEGDGDEDLEALLGGDADPGPEEWPVIGVDGDTLNVFDTAEAFEAGMVEAIGQTEGAPEVLDLWARNESTLKGLSKEARVRLRQVSDQRRTALIDAAAKAREVAPASEVDKGALRKVLQVYSKRHGAVQLRALLQQHGGARLDDIDPARYGDLMTAARSSAAGEAA